MIASSSQHLRSSPRCNELRVNMDEYVDSTRRVPYGIYRPSSVGAYMQVFLNVCGDTDDLDTHAHESFKVMNYSIRNCQRAYEHGEVTKQHVQLLGTVCRMLSQISTRLSFIYDTMWSRHVTKCIENETKTMEEVLAGDTSPSQEHWKRVHVSGALMLHCLIVDQLRFDCWSKQSLSTYKRWIQTFRRYCTMCIDKQRAQMTSAVRHALNSCHILECNIQIASRGATVQTCGFQDNRCTQCQKIVGLTTPYRMYRGDMVTSCEHAGDEQCSNSPPTGLRPTYPMLTTRGLHARGLIEPPRSFHVNVHRYTIVTLRMMAKVCNDRNSTIMMRKRILRAERSSSRVSDKSKQFEITVSSGIELFGLGVATSHESQLVLVDVLRSMQSNLSQYYVEGHVGDNIRAVMWYLDRIAIPIITHASMWNTLCKDYYRWCVDSVDTLAPRHQDQHTAALFESQFICNESETSADEDEQDPYTVECDHTVRQMDISGKWHKEDSKNKFEHRLRCQPCGCCGGQVGKKLYVAVVSYSSKEKGDGYYGKEGIVAICSASCAKRFHHRVTGGVYIQEKPKIA
jgi:hypothetical protein